MKKAWDIFIPGQFFWRMTLFSKKIVFGAAFCSGIRSNYCFVQQNFFLPRPNNTLLQLETIKTY